MSRRFLLAFVLATAMIGTVSAAPPVKGIFSPLEVGQKLIVKDTPRGYEIIVPKIPGTFTHEVVEVGSDWVVVKDVGILETRIPVYAVKCVTIMKR